jgi:hypothetical protein
MAVEMSRTIEKTIVIFLPILAFFIRDISNLYLQRDFERSGHYASTIA